MKRMAPIFLIALLAGDSGPALLHPYDDLPPGGESPPTIVSAVGSRYRPIQCIPIVGAPKTYAFRWK